MNPNDSPLHRTTIYPFPNLSAYGCHLTATQAVDLTNLIESAGIMSVYAAVKHHAVLRGISL